MKKKGIIALDIDGTITAERHHVSKNVIQYLSFLVTDGWQVIFITGRPFSWAFRSLQDVSFPYYFAVQNGALVLSMPDKKIVTRYYLNRSIIGSMEDICKNEPSDFVIYSGFENDDVCYYRSHHFSSDLLSYVQARSVSINEKWVDISTYDRLKMDCFPSVKCFGRLDSAKRMHEKIEIELGFHAPLMRDPLGENYYVVQVTAPHVNKGETLLRFHEEQRNSGPMIAAGDDANDISMLKVAQIKIVMETAPEEVLKLADIIAPSAEKEGIIEGLSKAVNQFKG